jgi:hypothetical protein
MSDDGPATKHRKKTGRTKPPLGGPFTTRNSHTSPRRILQRENEARAIELRKQGRTLAAIGEHFGVSAKTAYTWIVRGIERLVPPETAEIARSIELNRYDELLENWRDRALKDNPAAAKIYLNAVFHRIAPMLLDGMRSEAAGAIEPALLARAPEELQKRVAISCSAVTKSRSLARRPSLPSEFASAD